MSKEDYIEGQNKQELAENIIARNFSGQAITSPEKLKEYTPTKQQENSDIEDFRERLGNVEHNEKLNNALLIVLLIGIVLSIFGLAWSYWITIPNYQIEYSKQISELKTEYNSKILEQQNTINLQQEKIQNLEDDIKELKDIIKKIFY